jgi:hypothetical protein
MSSAQPFDLDAHLEDHLEGLQQQQQPANDVVSLVGLETLPPYANPFPVSEALPLLLLDGEDEDTDIDVDKDTEIDEDSDGEEPPACVAVPRGEDHVELLLSCIKSLTATHQEKLDGHETQMVIKRLKLVRTFEAARGKMLSQLEDSIVRRAKNVSILSVLSAQHRHKHFQAGSLAEKRVRLTRAQSKSLDKLMDMLSELRQMGLSVENCTGPRLVKRVISFLPYVKAVSSNVSSFFAYASMGEIAMLHQATASWFSNEKQSYFVFKNKLSEKAQGWMQLARQHPDGMRFVARHLLNVVKHWPKMLVVPTEKEKLAAGNKKVVRKLRELSKKTKGPETV